jgi:hypothetical protein
MELSTIRTYDPPMTTYQYHVLRLVSGLGTALSEPGGAPAEGILNDFGANGWHVVGFQAEQGRGDAYVVILCKAS